LIGNMNSRLSQRLLRGVLVFFLLISSLGLWQTTAYADVKKADIIFGESVDARGLSVVDCPNVDASYALVMAADGTIFFERNAHESTQIASITKVMTAIVVLDHAQSDTIVTVSERATWVGESSAGLEPGDQMSLDGVLKAIMLSSGNDAAVAVAEHFGSILSNGSATGEDAEQVFVEEMNKKAQELGMASTVFTNPHGLDHDSFAGEQRSTAADVAIMVQFAMKNETFREIVATRVADVSVKRANGENVTLTFESTDLLLESFEGACGVKTGFTDLAGPSFAGAANREKGEYYAIVLNSSSPDQRFTDAQVLLEWAYEHLVDYQLANSTQKMEAILNGQKINVPIVAEVAHADWIDKTVKATLKDHEQTISIFDLNGNINQTIEYDEIHGDIRVGDKLGTITFKQRNEFLLTVDIIACESMKAPGLFEGIGIWWDRLFRGFSGEPKVANSVLINETPLINQKGE